MTENKPAAITNLIDGGVQMEYRFTPQKEYSHDALIEIMSVFLNENKHKDIFECKNSGHPFNFMVKEIHNYHDAFAFDEKSDCFTYIPDFQMRDIIEAALKTVEGMWPVGILIEGRNVKSVQMRTLEALAAQDKNKASEILSDYCKKKFSVYTTRDDQAEELWVYVSDQGIYKPQGKTYINEVVRDTLGEAYTPQISTRVIAKIMADTYIELIDFFREESPEYIPVMNGVLNVRTLKLEGFSQSRRFFARIPVHFEPGRDCPIIKEHLETVMHKKDVPSFLEAVGSCLYRDNFMEKMLMLVGGGRNGKGKTLELVRRFLGPENCSSVGLQDIEVDQWAKADFQGKLANICGDISATYLKETGGMKSISGRDTVRAPRKFLSPLNFINYAKLFFSCNKLPGTADDTDAFWERWMMWEFSVKFVDKEEYDAMNEEEKKKHRVVDKDKISKLATDEELTGFLNLALEGLHRLLKNRRFTASQRHDQLRVEWLRKADSFEAFYMDCIEEAGDATVVKSELRRRYNEYCKKHNLKVSSDKAIKRIMDKKGIDEDQKIERSDYDDSIRHIRQWVGIRLKGVTDE